MNHLLYEVHNGVAYLTMNRPEARNALSLNMRTQMLEAFQNLESDDSVRCVVLQGAGEHFMSGGDVKSFKEFTRLTPEQRRLTFLNRIHNGLNGLMYTMRRLNKPVIASVQGAVAGAGVSLALSCDLVIAAEDSFFTLAYSHIASSPDGGATYYLPRLVGTKKAMEIALLGDRFSAAEARDMGMINRVVPGADIKGETRKLAERLAKGPTKAYGSIKKLILQSSDNSLEQQLQSEAEIFGTTAMADDWVEGVIAFNEKRKPEFTGR
ncbi:enoyl-CoA hydratase/isomerase family protein [Marinobacter sp. ANT_B65]|uniref:enoyl-CoA hydratase/isomerase family protein n=1 Tax=Marinobacter sp. ANT_B65 TaxID=2039467 RepID=UPI000BBE0BD2|nr:enoyl-CoA hydratase [Marinobacter sp. ANT_B65]PCM43292.1 enoyl-CoA hydratase [Marinobacter sp. ANT_B65]